MRKLFQTKWHDIPFSSFSNVSDTEMAGSEFYNLFYKKLFEKYSDYEDLDKDWRARKEDIAKWIFKKSFVQNNNHEKKKYLSIGCGLGIIERYLWRFHRNEIELFVQDDSVNAHKWLLKFFSKDKIFSSQELFAVDFDVIYLSAVDYALNDEDLIQLLINLKKNLNHDGIVIIISASFLNAISFRNLLFYPIIDCCTWVLKFTGLYKNENKQFWGWMRTRSDYRRILRKASFSTIEDGFIPPRSTDTYWILGRLS